MSNAEVEMILAKRREQQRNYFVDNGVVYDATQFELRNPGSRTDRSSSRFRRPISKARHCQKFCRVDSD